MGNMHGCDFISALEYFQQDKNTEIIMLYIESLKENSGRKFVELCRQISKNKKIIAIKAGKTVEGEKAAKTHTASLSSPAEIYSGAFKQTGIIEVDSLDEMFKLAEIFSKYKSLGRKACIITNAGGLGVLSVDVCAKAGIQIPQIPEKIIKELDKIMPAGYSKRNPLDILGDALAERYEKVIRILEKESWFDFFIVLLTPQAMTQANETARVLTGIKKPVFACFVGGKSLEEGKRILHEKNVLIFDDVSELGMLGKAKR